VFHVRRIRSRLQVMKLSFQIAVFDHDNPGAHRDYWVHRHPSLNRDTLNRVYYQAIAIAAPAGVASLEAGGALSVENESICLYRLLGGGVDKLGRGGHFIAVCAFANRSRALAADLSFVLQHRTFNEIAEDYRKGIDAPFLSELQLALDCPPALRGFLPLGQGESKRFQGDDALSDAFRAVSGLRAAATWRLEYRQEGRSLASTVGWTAPTGTPPEPLTRIEPPAPSRDGSPVGNRPGVPQQLLSWRVTVGLWAVVAVAILYSFLSSRTREEPGPPAESTGFPLSYATGAAFAVFVLGVAVGWKLRGRQRSS
jgi:hypothetical protein